MNKKFKTVMCATMAVASATGVAGFAGSVMADEVASASVEYSVPIYLRHANEDKESMGNKAMAGNARVIEKDGKATVYLNVKGLSFMGMFGHLWGMNVYEKGFDTTAKPVIIEKMTKDKGLDGADRDFPSLLKIERNSQKEDSIYINVEVDAMDAIASDGARTYDKIKKGAGSQKAIIKLDYSKAQKISEEKPQVPKAEVSRIAGSSRFATAAKISQANFQSADTVVLANGRKEADALAAAPLAAINKAPILLTEANILKAEAETEIKRLGAKNVIIAGGKGSVSADVEAKLVAMGVKVERIAGANRYATSLEIANKVREKSGNKGEAILVNGKQSADALAVSSLAVKNMVPIVLAEANKLPEDTKMALNSWDLAKLTVVGGENSVNESVKNQVKAGQSVRIAGKSRYATSVAVARAAYPQAKSLMIANGKIAADALAAGVTTGNMASPIILVDGRMASPELKALVNENKVEKLILVGGQTSVSDSVVSSIYTK